MQTQRVSLFLITAAALSLAACSDAQPPVAGPPATSSQQQAAAVAAATQPIPAGFRRIAAWDGISVYQKDYRGGQPDYVTVVDLGRARLHSLAGAAASGGRLHRQALSAFWTTAQRTPPGGVPRVMVNAAFFSTNDNPTGLAFGLKHNGAVVSYGYGADREFPGKVRTLSLARSRQSAAIRAYSRSTFTGSDPEVVGALDPTADKSAGQYVGRTFVGVRDGDRNGSTETLLLFSSAYSRQRDADAVLRGFGAQGVVMMDGGGSTGLVVNGATYVRPGRTIPHVLLVSSAR